MFSFFLFFLGGSDKTSVTNTFLSYENARGRLSEVVAFLLCSLSRAFFLKAACRVGLVSNQPRKCFDDVEIVLKPYYPGSLS